MKALGIYGAGGLGREVLELARIINSREKRWSELFFVVDDKGGEEVNGIEVKNYTEAITEYSDQVEITLAIGEPADRERLFAKLRTDRVELATLIHPDVHIPDTTTIGKGVTIQYGCFISCNIEIEDYVFIQSQVLLGHDVCLKKGCIISAKANIGGFVTIDEYAFVGLSALLKDRIKIGKYSIIVMGAVVFRDMGDEMIVMGNPARPTRKNEERRVFK